MPPHPSVPSGLVTSVRSVRAAGFGALALAGVLLGGFGCKGGASTGGARMRPPPLVSVAAVERRDVPLEVRAPVDIRPLAVAEVGSKTLGYLDAVLVERGDAVRKGQLLALVRPSDLPDQLSAARSSLAQAQSSAALARTNLERAQALAPRAVVSQQELQQTSARAAEAEAAEQAARAQISALAVRLGETKILSPMTGVVLQRRLDPGVLVGPPGGGPIITVARMDVVRVFVAVAEREIAGVAVGQTARLEVDAIPGRTFEGKVVRVSPGLDPATRTLDAEVQIENRDGLLRAGMYGRAAIVREIHPRALVLPVGAVQLSSEGGAHVFVIESRGPAQGQGQGQDNVAKRKRVTIGIDGGNWLEITEGLTGNERVVTAGMDALADGMKVRVAAPARQGT